jgi:hypothetical protein
MKTSSLTIILGTRCAGYVTIIASRPGAPRKIWLITTISPLTDEEVKQQLLYGKTQVEQSNDEEKAANTDNTTTPADGNKSPIAAHQQEIIDLDAKIDQLEKEFTCVLDEKLDLLKSPQTGTADDKPRPAPNRENTNSRGDNTFIGFYNRKQDLRSWCQDGHPDENRFRENGWNPVWSADTKEDILKWAMHKNSTSSLSTQRSGNETPQDQGISNKLPKRSQPAGGNRSKSAWGNAMAKLQETARQLGMEMARQDPT